MAVNYSNNMPEWQNEGVEPSNDLKEKGFQGGYKPPASVFNWFWSLVSKAITELQTITKNQLDKINEFVSTQIIPTGSDLNDVRAEGYYYAYGNYNIGNRPSGTTTKAFNLRVRILANQNVSQEFTDTDGNKYIRTYVSSAWSDWTQFSKVGHKHTLDDISETSNKKIMTSTERDNLLKVTNESNLRGALYFASCNSYTFDDQSMCLTITLSNTDINIKNGDLILVYFNVSNWSGSNDVISYVSIKNTSYAFQQSINSLSINSPSMFLIGIYDNNAYFIG